VAADQGHPHAGIDTKTHDQQEGEEREQAQSGQHGPAVGRAQHLAEQVGLSDVPDSASRVIRALEQKSQQSGQGGRGEAAPHQPPHSKR